jgi:DNA sulfur modification protein DndD
VILNQLTLTNFGIYKGEHTVALSPTAKKPIILFGAYNGSGKTTFLDALQLVLYGKAAKTSSRGRTAYDDYLRGLINRDVSPKQGAGLNLIFTSKSNGKNERIEISRTWFDSGSAIKENCEVKRDGVYDPVSSERWHEFVEEFMPSEISELFFFDGEKIEGLADPYRSAAILRSGIYSLLGINSIESLIKSLGQIEKRKANEISKDSEGISLEQEEIKAKDLALKKDSFSQEIGSLKNQLDRVFIEIARAEDEMKLSGADLLVGRHSLQEQLSVLRERKKSINIEMLDIAAGRAPLLILRELIASLRNNINKASGHNLKSLELIHSEISGFKNKIKSLGKLDLDLEKEIFNIFDSREKDIIEEVDNFSVEANLADIPDNEELTQLAEGISLKVTENQRLEDEIDSINKNLQAVPSEDKVKEIIQALNEKQKEQARIEAKLEVLGRELDEVSTLQERVGREIATKLNQISQQETEQIISQRVLNHSQAAKETLIKFKHELVKKHLESLSDQITECFRLLHRKSKFDLRFKINEDDFSLSILKSSNESVPAKSLSAGERQLLAVAILWALAKSSGKTLPTVIDTPLGRLDGPHRQKLISNYFPKAGSQVLIFSTDEEITPNYYKSLKPYISREYSINYDESSESSIFEDGYFECEIN